MLVIIGGSGLDLSQALTVKRRQAARTPFGEPSGALTFAELAGAPVLYLARHGYGQTIAPHRVNYRANLWAVAETTASCLISVTSVGAIRADLHPGQLMAPCQIIDYTWGRANTFFANRGRREHRLDFAEPFCEPLRQSLLTAGRRLGLAMHDGGVSAVSPGPRQETAAEVIRMQRDGADVIGMTCMPEAVLARELDMPYASLHTIIQYAAGVKPTARSEPVSRDQQRQQVIAILSDMAVREAEQPSAVRRPLAEMIKTELDL